jgi:circadian clock protein KaiC
MSPELSRQTLPSGVPQLDRVLGGGIPAGDLLLIVGAPGSGKTTLACQAAFTAARRGEKVVFISTLSEPASRLVKHLRTFSFWEEALLGRSFFFESILPVAHKGARALVEAVIESMRSHGAGMLVIDGFASLRDLHPDSRELRTFVNQLAIASSAMNCTTLVTSSDAADMRSASSPPEFTMCDSIVELSQSLSPERQRRTLRAWKVRGAQPLLGPHAFRISREGLAVYPRLSTLEALGEEPAEGLEQEHPRAPWGIPELDTLLGGGLPRAGSSILAGASGTGKTLLALQFVLEGARRGERAVWFSFRESPAQLIRKARSFQLDLETPLREGRIVISRRLPVEVELDPLCHELWTEIVRVDARRLVVDSIAELEWVLPEQQDGTLVALNELLRLRAITALFTKEVGGGADGTLDFAGSPLAVLAENVVVLRQRELHATAHRVVSVLKMRESSYDPSLREYHLRAGGLQVLAPGESDVLRALARTESGTGTPGPR